MGALRLQRYRFPVLYFLLGILVSVLTLSIFYEKWGDLVTPGFIETRGQGHGLPNATVEAAIVAVPPPMDSDEISLALNVSSNSVFVLYELYYSEIGWPHLHSYKPYRPLCIVVGKRRSGSDDIDAPMLSPGLRNQTWQNLICEYGAILTVASHLEEIQQGAKWLGFQSWRAAQKHSALSEKAILVMEANMRERQSSGFVDVMYFWSDSDWSAHDFWAQCDE